MSGEKLDERLYHCDGEHHRWSYERPIRCKGCGELFTDIVPPRLRAAIEQKNAERGRPLTAREKLDNLARWLKP